MAFSSPQGKAYNIRKDKEGREFPAGGYPAPVEMRRGVHFQDLRKTLDSFRLPRMLETNKTELGPYDSSALKNPGQGAQSTLAPRINSSMGRGPKEAVWI